MSRSLAVIAVIALIGAVYAFVVSPLSDKREETRAKLIEELETLTAYEELVGGGGISGQETKASAGELKKLEKGVLPSSDVSLSFSGLQMRIQETAKDRGISITSIKPLPPVKYEGYTGLPIQVDASGDIEGLSGFLRSLDSGALLIRTEKLDVAVAAQQKLRVRIQLLGLMKS